MLFGLYPLCHFVLVQLWQNWNALHRLDESIYTTAGCASGCDAFHCFDLYLYIFTQMRCASVQTDVQYVTLPIEFLYHKWGREREPHTHLHPHASLFTLLKASPVSFVCSFELVFLAKIQFFLITSVYLIMNWICIPTLNSQQLNKFILSVFG